MDFDLSEEQRLLKDSVDGLLADIYDFEARKKHGAATTTFVMAGLDPAIHVSPRGTKDVDARDKRGRDDRV